MISRRVWINLAAFFALFALLSAWAVRNVITLDLVEQPYRVSARFESSPGLRPNVEVTYLGVRIGTIDAVGLDGDTVQVDMDVDRDTRLPEGLTAAVRRKSAAGEPYVALEAPAGYDGGGPYVESGYTIGVESTSIPLSYGELFTAVDDLVASIPPADLDTVVHELALALEGRGPTIRRLLASGEDLTTTLAERSGLLDELATELTSLTHTISASSERIGTSFDNVAALADTLAGSRADIEALLTTAPDVGARVDALLRASLDDLGCAFRDTGSFVAQVGTPAHIGELLRLLRAAGPARDALDAALVEPGQDGADGPYLGGSFSPTGETDLPPAYDSPVQLPEPPPILDCVGTGSATPEPPGNDEVAGPGSGTPGADGPGVTVGDRPARPAASVPGTTDARAGSEAFPLAEVLAALGALLLVALVAATKPWRLVAAGRRPPSDEDGQP